MLKLLLLILGMLFASLGLVNILFYLNLVFVGYSMFDFIIFIFSNFYTLLFWIGLVMIYFSKKIK